MITGITIDGARAFQGNMKRFILWTMVFLALLLAADQLLIRMPSSAPALAVVQDFYRDFRGRLFGLVDGKAERSIEEVIERAESQRRPAGKPGVSTLPAVKDAEKISRPARKPAPAPAAKAAAPAPAGEDPRYLYVDGNGDLQFAASLDEVPARFRKDAQPMQQ